MGKFIIRDIIGNEIQIGDIIIYTSAWDKKAPYLKIGVVVSVDNAANKMFFYEKNNFVTPYICSGEIASKMVYVINRIENTKGVVDETQGNFVELDE